MRGIGVVAARYLAKVKVRVRFSYPAPILMMLCGCTTVHPTDKFDLYAVCEKVSESRPLVENGNRTPDGFYTQGSHDHYRCNSQKQLGFSYRF